jgi:hypothetical protein
MLRQPVGALRVWMLPDRFFRAKRPIDDMARPRNIRRGSRRSRVPATGRRTNDDPSPRRGLARRSADARVHRQLLGLPRHLRGDRRALPIDRWRARGRRPHPDPAGLRAGLRCQSGLHAAELGSTPCVLRGMRGSLRALRRVLRAARGRRRAHAQLRPDVPTVRGVVPRNGGERRLRRRCARRHCRRAQLAIRPSRAPAPAASPGRRR